MINPPGANVIKLFTAESYEFSVIARAFFSGKPFQPSLMFAGKAKHLSGTLLEGRLLDLPTNIRLG